MMELDDLKKAVNEESEMISNTDRYSFKEIKTKVNNFNRAIKRNFFIESSVAAFAFIMVIMTIIVGPTLYPMVINELLPELMENTIPEMNVFMYTSLVLMALYCIFVPIYWKKKRTKLRLKLRWV